MATLYEFLPMGNADSANLNRPLTHGYINRVIHADMQVPVNGQSAVRYMRFARNVKIDYLTLPRSVTSRWSPSVPNHPRHLTVWVLDKTSNSYRMVKEVELQYDPRIAGKGLKEGASIDECNEFFGEILKSPPQIITLDGVITDHLRIVCDREYEVYPSGGETNGNKSCVPFSILDKLEAHGEIVGDAAVLTQYNPILRCLSCRPEAPAGVKIKVHSEKITFESKYLSIGFSMRRPLLLHMGWDAFGSGRAGSNRHALQYAQHTTLGHPSSGPLLRTVNEEYVGRLWSGEIEIEGNRIHYRNLRAIEGLILDITFEVEEKKITMSVRQTCDRPIPAIEYEAWRWMWDCRAGITGVAAEPTLLAGRNGDVKLPMMFASDGSGCLSCRMIDGDESGVRTQVESYKLHAVVSAGLSLVDRNNEHEPLMIPAGQRKAAFILEVDNLEPDVDNPNIIPPGIARQWSAMFACFRPEFGGFSNNAVSTHCMSGVETSAWVALNTKKPKFGPNPLQLQKFTTERHIMGGGGYMYWRSHFMESDPAIICSVASIYQVEKDVNWLKKITPGFEAAMERIFALMDPHSGMFINPEVSGNSGSEAWSTNLMDLISFGHIDGYSNAMAYRALRNATALFRILNKTEKALESKRHADNIKAKYAHYLLNPETGLIAGWRSRDGQLHDYGFSFVNGAAVAFGLLEHNQAVSVLKNFEALRKKVDAPNGRLGLPINLLPQKKEDHILWKFRGEISPTFEAFTDGSMMTFVATHYLRALDIYGFKDEARRLALEIDDGMNDGIFSGGIGSGAEMYYWDGCPNGYEGTLLWNFSVLYAVAVTLGVLTPMEEEYFLKDDTGD